MEKQHKPGCDDHIEGSKSEKILGLLTTKSVLKQKIFDNTFEIFNQLKEVLEEVAGEFGPTVSEIDRRVTVEYTSRGMFEAQLKVAGDILVFSMFTNAFEFDRNHTIWKNSFTKDNPQSTISGMISIYNFLHDSFRYNHMSDLGYLIARIFVNKDLYYFVEGKQQMNNWVNNFGTAVISKEILRDIVESAILYTLNFDLLVPPYDSVKIITLDQINSKINSARFQTGKRLGFTFNSDDVSAHVKTESRH
ncbi:MAG: hypothetical protein LBQ60_01425 [Bacteroidales bacterium]|nr:hypothetical protein [Bacteroidales bacterium]